jgi:hypothetical protein
MAYLTVRIKGVEGYSKVRLDKDRVVVGRSSDCGLPVAHASVSREHCAVLRVAGADDAWEVEDLGSANGTAVNKQKLAGRVRLAERDIIAAGQARITFHAGSADAVEAAVDLQLAGADGPVRRRAEGDPPEAVPCAGCGAWLSIAHRVGGDRHTCPRCGREAVVPTLVG